MMKSKLAYLGLSLFMLSACASLVTVIPPKAMTNSAMSETKVRIDLYIAAHQEYPTDLSMLAEREGYANSTTDGWGRPLDYSVDDQGNFSLTSLGRDGKPGGEGDDEDIHLEFQRVLGNGEPEEQGPRVDANE